MRILRPNISALDATHPKSDDFNRILLYLTKVVESLGGAFNSGILYGMQLVPLNTTTLKLTEGAALAADGSIIFVEDGDVTVPIATVAPFFYGEASLGDIWLYWTGTTGEVERAVSSGELIDVAYEDTYSIGVVAKDATTTFDAPKVLLGTTIDQLAGSAATTASQFVNSFIWNETTSYIEYNYALDSLQHTGELNASGKYTGPKLGPGAIGTDAIGTAQLQDGAVTDTKIDTGIDGSKIVDGTVDAQLKLVNFNYTGNLINDYTISAVKLGRDIPRSVALPTAYALPIATTVGGVSVPSYDVFEVSKPSTNLFKNKVEFLGTAATAGGFMGDTAREQAHKAWYGTYGISLESADNISFSHAPLSGATSPHLVIYGSVTDYNTSRRYPHVAKISNYTAASVGYPDYIEVTGRVPYIRPTPYAAIRFINNADIGTPGAHFACTPYFVPPDGYIIESMSVTLGFNLPFTSNIVAPYTNPIVEYEALVHMGWDGISNSNPPIINRYAGGTIGGTMVRGLVGHQNFASLWEANGGDFSSFSCIKMVLKYVDPRSPADSQYGIGVPSVVSGTVSPFEYLGGFIDTTTAPYHLQYKPAFTNTQNAPAKALKVWKFIDRDAII